MRILSQTLLFLLSFRVSQSQDTQDATWDYTSQGDDWPNKPDLGLRVPLKNQSPIDLPAMSSDAVVRDDDLAVKYWISTHAQQSYIFEKTSHGGVDVTTKMDTSAAPLGEVTSNDKTYEIKGVHFHAGSEHLFDGVRTDLEAHFVSLAKGANETNLLEDDYLVIGIHFSEGPNENQMLKHVLDHYPGDSETSITMAEEATVSNFTQALDDQVGADKYIYRYPGSFTTPPCTEVVSWAVGYPARKATRQQLDQLFWLLKPTESNRGNYRNVQPASMQIVHTDIVRGAGWSKYGLASTSWVLLSLVLLVSYMG